MKKILAILMLTLILAVIVVPVIASAETYNVPLPGTLTTGAEETVTAPEPTSSSPWTWSYLATIAGATAATLLITQFVKAPLDKVWKIPTRLFVYLLALIIMVVATAFTSGITVNTFLLAILNAFIVALTAYGSYEITFAKAGKP